MSGKHYNEFQVHDKNALLLFIQKYPFASIVKNSNKNIPALVQAPIICNDLVLEFHMAKENPSFEIFKHEGDALFIFNGPNAHVSASWYKDKNPMMTASTWDYASVHLTASIIKMTKHELVEHLQRLVKTFEGTLVNGWDFSSIDPKFLEKLIHLIEGFKVEIKDIVGIFKFSQNQSLSDQKNIISSLEARRSAFDVLVAQIIRESQ